MERCLSQRQDRVRYRQLLWGDRNQLLLKTQVRFYRLRTNEFSQLFQYPSLVVPFQKHLAGPQIGWVIDPHGSGPIHSCSHLPMKRVCHFNPHHQLPQLNKFSIYSLPMRWPCSCRSGDAVLLRHVALARQFFKNPAKLKTGNALQQFRLNDVGEPKEDRRPIIASEGCPIADVPYVGRKQNVSRFVVNLSARLEKGNGEFRSCRQVFGLLPHQITESFRTEELQQLSHADAAAVGRRRVLAYDVAELVFPVHEMHSSISESQGVDYVPYLGGKVQEMWESCRPWLTGADFATTLAFSFKHNLESILCIRAWGCLEILRIWWCTCSWDVAFGGVDCEFGLQDLPPRPQRIKPAVGPCRTGDMDCWVELVL